MMGLWESQMAGSPQTFPFLRTAKTSPPSLRCASTRWNLRMCPREALQARGGVAQVGQALPETCTYLVARESTVRGLLHYSTTYGNALPEFRLMLPARARALAPGAS